VLALALALLLCYCRAAALLLLLCCCRAAAVLCQGIPIATLTGHWFDSTVRTHVLLWQGVAEHQLFAQLSQ
jgi:hypothetical protein